MSSSYRKTSSKLLKAGRVASATTMIPSCLSAMKEIAECGYTPCCAVTAFGIKGTEYIFIIYFIVAHEMAKKLHYFDSNGIAESIRYMLHYGKQKFEDMRYDYKTWPVEDVKKTLPFGQLPIYEEGNKTLNQSLAIARYVAVAHNLLPTDPWDQAQLDAIVFTVYDFWAKIVAYIREQNPVKKQTLRKEIFDEVIEFYFSRFESQLKNNKGFFGGKISWADFVFIGILEAANLQLGDQIERKYPHIVALLDKIRTLPGVKEYISMRKHYVL